MDSLIYHWLTTGNMIISDSIKFLYKPFFKKKKLYSLRNIFELNFINVILQFL